MAIDTSGAGYGNHSQPPEEKGGHDGAKSRDYEADDKSDPDDQQDNLEDRRG